MRIKLVFLCTFMLLSFVTTSFAGDFFITPSIGTLGFGGDIGYQFNSFVKTRINVNYIPLKDDYKKDGINYDAKLKMFTAGWLLDLHPFSGSFRVSGGLYYRDLKLDIDVSPSADRSYKIGGVHYDGKDLDSISGRIKWDKFTPYAGIGWGTDQTSESGFSFDSNLGVMLLRGVKIDYDVNGNTGVIINQADVDREAQRIKNDVDKYKLYPVLNIGFTYRF